MMAAYGKFMSIKTDQTYLNTANLETNPITFLFKISLSFKTTWNSPALAYYYQMLFQRTIFAKILIYWLLPKIILSFIF